MPQEREKRRIVIASVLKPVDDTRMFEKMAVSLAGTGEYQVSIIGYPSQQSRAYQNIDFAPLGEFPRVSLGRWLAKWKVLARAWAKRPSVFLFNTHELIFPAIVMKVMLNCLIIYDVRENYYRNIRHSEGLPFFLRIPLALLVRFKEKLTAPAIDHFILAEKGYENEFRFHRGGWTVIQNKALKNDLIRVKKLTANRLLFSGTLAEATGVFRAVELAKQLHGVEPSITLTVIGYASTEHLRSLIRKTCESLTFITLIGIDHLVPHTQIADAISQSDAGILAYPLSDHTRNSVPSKLFEYLRAGLPIILENQWPWIETYAQSQPFIVTDFNQPDLKAILEQLRSGNFYPTIPPNVDWESEADMLRSVLRKLTVG